MVEEKMGIIKDVGIGLRDASVPILWFTVYTSEVSASLQVFNWKEAEDLIKQAGVYRVEQMNGMPCLVEENGILVKFIRILHIK